MPRYASLEAMPFANETLSVLMHVNHPLAKEKSLRVSDLDNSNVLFGLEGIGLIRNLHRTGCSQAPTAASTFRFENVIMDVKSNSGVAILPKSEIGFHQPDVVGVPLVDEDLGFMVMMVYRKDNVSQKMKRFLDVVKNNGEQESLIGST
jgi:DNA-binding transcriptional LysR family regulator